MTQNNLGTYDERDRIRNTNLRFICGLNNTNCLNRCKMRSLFFNMCSLLKDRQLLKDNINNTVEEQVAMFLHVVEHNTWFRALQPVVRRSIEVFSRYFKEVLFAVRKLLNEMIKLSFSEVHPKIPNSRRFYPYFKDCIGAIDGTHVLVRVFSSIVATCRGKRGIITQNVMVVVDFDLRFTYVLAGWEGSAYDALILVDVLEKENDLSVSLGKSSLKPFLEGLLLNGLERFVAFAKEQYTETPQP